MAPRNPLICDFCESEGGAVFPYVVMVRLYGGEVGMPCMLCETCYKRRESIKGELGRKRASQLPNVSDAPPDFLRPGA